MDTKRKDVNITDFKTIRKYVDGGLMLGTILIIYAVLLAAGFYLAFIIIMGIGDVIKTLLLGKWLNGLRDFWMIIVALAILFYFSRAVKKIISLDLVKKYMKYYPDRI